MSISFNGIGEVIATFGTADPGVIKAGDVVVLTGDGEVGPGSSGDQFCGVAVTVAADGVCGVQIDGLTAVRYTGTAPTAGYDMLAADGSGGVTAVSSNGSTYLVVAVDEDAKTAVIKL